MGIKLEEAKSWPKWKNGPIVLYHGTISLAAATIVRDGVDVSRGKNSSDFGRGFYTTTSLPQARVWAQEKAIRELRDKNTTVDLNSVVQLTLDRLALRELRSLGFVRGEEDAVDFWSFVSHCRLSTQLAPITDRYYDVVYGPVTRRRFGPGNCSIFPGYDQISFHGHEAERLLRDPALCSLEVVK